MEIHARYIWVGLITFIGIIATVWYILWISIAKDGRSQVLYDIYFSQNIAGLQEGSSVLLRGVPVGRVLFIRFDTKNTTRVQVRIQLTNTAPIRQDSIATIEPQGITGLANIQITGGSPSSGYLRPYDTEDIPVIQAGTSRFEEILSAVPNILVTTTTILNKIDAFINPKNINKLQNILANVDITIGYIAEQRKSIESFLNSSNKAFLAFEKSNAIFTDYINTELYPVTASIRKTIEQVPATIKLINERIEDISALGIDAQKTILQVKSFIIRLDKALQSFQANPKQFFFGNAYPEFKN